MKLQSLLEIISNCLTSEEQNNVNILDLLEKSRENIIEKLRILNKSDITNLNTEIKKAKSIKKDILFKDLKFNLSIDYFDKNILINKKSSSFHILEIIFNGNKKYKIYDKNNNNIFVNYRIMPFYGVVFSSETIFSSETKENTILLTINVDN
tara:strand:- start:335 stop:790 length:456 start_codon:yes stop_codon:yes gene_type:complete